MTIALTDFTTYGAVRAVLGTNVDEIDDATLALDMYVEGLQYELLAAGEKVSPGSDLPADYLIAAAEETPTVDQARLISAVALLAPYAVALQLASSLPQFSPKSITGEKIGFSRQIDSYKATLVECSRSFSKYLANLEAAYGGYKGASVLVVARTYLGVSTPTTDPVVG